MNTSTETSTVSLPASAPWVPRLTAEMLTDATIAAAGALATYAFWPWGASAATQREDLEAFLLAFEGATSDDYNPLAEVLGLIAEPDWDEDDGRALVRSTLTPFGRAAANFVSVAHGYDPLPEES